MWMVSLILFLFVINVVVQGQAPWHTLQGDLSRRSYSNISGPIGAEQQAELWTLQGFGFGLYYGVAYAGSGNVAYLVVQDSVTPLPTGLYLIAVSIESGKFLWQYGNDNNDNIYCYAAVHPSLPRACAIFYNTNNFSFVPFVACFEAQTGVTVWNTSLPQIISGSTTPFRAVIEFVSQNILLVTNQQAANTFNTFIGISNTGSVLWTTFDLFPTFSPSTFWGGPPIFTFYRDYLFFSNISTNSDFWGLSAFQFEPSVPSSRLLWTFTPPQHLIPTALHTALQPIASQDGLLVWSFTVVEIGKSNSVLFGIDSTNGSMRWAVIIPLPLSGLALSGDNVLTVATASSLVDYKNRSVTLQAYNISFHSASKIWENNLSGPATYGFSTSTVPSIDSNGIVYICNGSLVGFDVHTGESVFQHHGKPCLQQPTVASLNRLLFNIPYPAQLVAVGKATPPPPATPSPNNIEKYWWAFVIGGVTVLAAIVGAVYIAKRRRIDYTSVQ